MFRKFTILSLLFVPLILAQDPYPDNELTIQVTDAPNKTITFAISPLGTVFCHSTGCDFEEYASYYYSSTLTTDATGDILCADNGFDIRYCNEGNNTYIQGCAQSTAGIKPLRTGFYKMIISENGVSKGYCYFDWRDKGFPVNIGCDNDCTGNDMSIRYDGDDNVVRFYNYPNPPKGDNGTILSNGDIITWGEVKNCSPRSFYPFWSEGLILIKHNNRVRLVWGPYDNINFSIQNYRIYRAVGSLPPLSNFTHIATNEPDDFDFIDYDYNLRTFYGTLHYYVIANIIPMEGGEDEDSPPTNVVTYSGDQWKKISTDLEDTGVLNYSLEQNYPNPFNPSTTINYSTKKDGIVTLKVFDIIGNEVATLVDEYKNAGIHSIEFNAESVPSGIYIYTLSSASFKAAKKLILLK